MTDCAKKHMIYLTAWFLCMGFILLSNFSWIALGILVVLSVVSLYKNVFGVDGKIFQYTTLNIRYYILISVLFIECIYIIKNWNGFDSKYIGDNFFTLIEDAFSKVTGYCKTHLSFVVPGGILSVFFVIIRGKLIKHPFIHTLFEYQFTILFYFLVWAALFDNADLNLAYIIFAVLFLMGDLVRKVYDEDKTLGNKAGKRCMGWFSFILMLAAIFNLQVAEQLEAFDFDMVTVLFSKWSTFLFLFIMSLAVLISVSLIEPYLRTGYAYEKSVLLTVTSIIPVIFVSTRICVGYRWALLICYFAYVLISVIKIGPRALDDKYTYTINDYLPVPILSISSIFLMLEAQYGKVLIAAIFLISTLILVLVFSINVPVIDNVYDVLPTDDTGDKYECGYVLPESILAPFNNQEKKICGETFKKGSDALTSEWTPDMDLDENPVSIVCRVFKALDEVVLDTKRGPIYAAKMLFGSDKKNIINIISGIEKTAKLNRDAAYSNIDLTVKAVKKARAEYNNRPKFDPFGKKKNELFGILLNAIRNDISRRCEYKRYDYLCKALATAKEQLLALYNNYFKKYADVIRDLMKVFEKNEQAIAALQDINSDPFMLPMFKIRDLCSTLDEEVKKLLVGTEIANFNYAFYKKAYETWHSGNEELISAWISKYMSIIFRNPIALTFDDVPMLTKAGCDKVIQELDDKASEMFLLDSIRASRVYTHADTLAYCSATDTAPVLNDAIEEYKVINPTVRTVSESRNRIFFLKITTCVPMFAYGLIDEMYAAYQEAKSVTGKHLYEGAAENGDPRNWQTDLPDLRPYSIYKDIDWTTPEKVATAAAYKTAEYEAGIIHSEIDSTGNETGHYYIWRTPDYMPKLMSAKELADKAQEIVENEKSTLEDYQNILKKLNDEQNDLKSYKEELIDYRLTYGSVNNSQKLVKPEIPPISILNDGYMVNPDTAFDVRRDYVLASPILMNVVKEELGKVNKYNEVMAQLTEVTAAVSAKLSRIEHRI